VLTSAQRDTSRGPGLRERLLDAARTLCFEEGVAGVSARKIAARVGCSATAIYLHFESIEHVLHAIRMEGHALLTSYLQRPGPELHAVERICRMQREYHRFGLEHDIYFRVMFSSRVDGGPLGELVVAEGASLGVVRAAAAMGIARGEIDASLDPLVIANVCWMSVHGLTSMVVSGHAAVTAPNLGDELLSGVTHATRAWLGAAPSLSAGQSLGASPGRGEKS
jgi:AcrR family transcriptional regulator